MVLRLKCWWEEFSKIMHSVGGTASEAVRLMISSFLYEHRTHLKKGVKRPKLEVTAEDKVNTAAHECIDAASVIWNDKIFDEWEGLVGYRK
jgi:hypothetical protein